MITKYPRSTFDFSEMPLPGVDAIAQAALEAKESSPNRDGIPYLALSRAGTIAHETLFYVTLWLASGCAKPISFNDSVTLCVPNGSAENDAREVVRDPFGLRPISLKNTDNKIIAGACNLCMGRSFGVGACGLQRGFIEGRRVLEIVMELDTSAWISSLQSPPRAPLILAFWDYTAAFPSVIYAWIFASLSVHSFPIGFFDIVLGMYTCCFSCTSVGGLESLFATIISGMLKEWPLSGTIFATALDIFLNRILPIQAVGQLLSELALTTLEVHVQPATRWSKLRQIHTFECGRRVARLSLKPCTCIIVPLHCRFSLHVVSLICSCHGLHGFMFTTLRGNSSESSPQVSTLGFMLGLAAGVSQSSMAVGKWCTRANAIAPAGAAASVAARLYNVRAVPVLGYIAQMRPVPRRVKNFGKEASVRNLEGSWELVWSL